MEKVAAYIRVSTEEQKLHGISLDSQRDKLTEYANNHNLNIVGWYCDEGISGRKLIKHRPALQRMLFDAQAHKFERIIFIKLDRFFRSVAEYHECMKLIEPVVWTATEEKYDLTTANGRAFVNMKLTIAELEADQTGERIKIVNDYKVKTGQPLTGSQSQGLAYIVAMVDNSKRVIRDPERMEMVNDILNHFITYQNKTSTCKYIYSKYGYPLKLSQLTNLLTDTKLYGCYRNNPNYCEPYIDKGTFDKIQEVLSHNIKRSPSGRVYLFSGLIKCPSCGRRLTVLTNNYGNFYYRCNYHYLYRRCDNHVMVSEIKLEKDLLEYFNHFVTTYIANASVTDNRPDIDNAQINKRIAEIKTEMANSVKSFNKGRMTEAEHDREYSELEAELKELIDKLTPQVERDLTSYEELLKSGWREIYKALNRDNRRAFWRKYIQEIIVDSEGLKDIIFFNG